MSDIDIMARINNGSDLPLRGMGDDPQRASSENPDTTMYVLRTATHQLDHDASNFGIKESKWVPRDDEDDVPFIPRTLQDLHGYTATRKGFTLPHAESERTDAWFEQTFRHLFLITANFAVRHLGAEDLPSNIRRSPWREMQFPTQFVEYVSQVSRHDSIMGGWDELLLDKRHRTLLVTGVISKVLVNCVFSDLLWGADTEQGKLLEAHDKATISDDGYKRTNRRAKMVKDLLGYNVLTPNFWPRVDELATQVLSLLLPLINYQGQALPTWKHPSLRVLYQDLHDIIAEAAYFSICIRLSKTVFEIEFPHPGDFWDLDQEQLEEEHIYQRSKANAIEYDIKQERSAEAARVVREARNRTHARRGARGTYLFNDEGNNPQHTRPLRVAKVKIAAWPRIRRHKPLGSVEEHGAMNSERVVMVFKSQVAYYSGRSDDMGETLERKPTLPEYLRRRKSLVQRAKPAPSPAVLLLLSLLAFTFILAFLRRDLLLEAQAVAHTTRRSLVNSVRSAATYRLADLLLSTGTSANQTYDLVPSAQ